jgi:hypothetical protein
VPFETFPISERAPDDRRATIGVLTDAGRPLAASSTFGNVGAMAMPAVRVEHLSKSYGHTVWSPKRG